MSVRARIAIALTVVVTLGSVAPAAQREGGSGPGERMSPGQVQRLFDAMLVMQAQEVLALDEPQQAEFVSRVQGLQQTRRRHQLERLRLLGELQRLTSPRAAARGVDDAAVARHLRTLQELEARAAADLRRAYQRVDEVLTPLQQARFRVLEDQIERRKLELVGRARQNARGAGGGPARPPTRKPPGQ